MRSPRARNSSAETIGLPGARLFQWCGALAPDATRQRNRAADRLGVASRRTNISGTPDRSAASTSRREAVKSRLLGSPVSSPSTNWRVPHLTPSSIAHRASAGVRAETWIRPVRSGGGSPWRKGRPKRWMLSRSCTHSQGSLWRAPSLCPNASARPSALASSPLVKISQSDGGSETSGDQTLWFPLIENGRSVARRWSSTAKDGEEHGSWVTSGTTRLESMFLLCSHDSRFRSRGHIARPPKGRQRPRNQVRRATHGSSVRRINIAPG